MSQKRDLTRRGFLAATAGAFAAPYIIPSTALGRGGATAPSERIVIGLIGCGGMGRGNTRNCIRHQDVHVVGVCDIDAGRRGEAAGDVNKHYGNDDCKQYADYRELVGRDDLDAVIIATPDHWHAQCAVDAAKAKKHIFCQKPMTHTFAEGQRVVAAVKENGVIFQVGSQQRSDRLFRHAVNLVRNGHIGKVNHVEVGLPTGHKEAKNQGGEHQPPANCDYDFWCGPSAMLPFHPDRFHWNWRWHLSYGGGQLMDWIGHHNDIAHWGLDMDKSGPVEVEAVGFEYPSDRSVWNAAWKYDVRTKYESGVTSSISNQYPNGLKWIGEDGWVWVTRGQIDASEKAWLEKDFEAGDVQVYLSQNHERNWLDGILTGKECICPAETGHRSITPGHLGLVSEAVGRKLKWDPKDEKIVGDEEAQKLLATIDYRAPWKLA